MDVALWIGQVALALLFLGVGTLKALLPPAELAKRFRATPDLPLWQIRLIGAVELLGGAGVLVPTATGILPWLASAAAGGLVLLMAAAAGVHFGRGENRSLPVNAAILVVAAFVAYGRLTPLG